MLKMTLDEIRGYIQIYPENWINISTTNCYAYALGLDIKESQICDFAYQPGSISKTYNPNQLFYYNTLIKNIEEDLKALDILYREIETNDQIVLGEWKMALLVDLYKDDQLVTDFHFLRTNSNGLWIHKPDYHSLPTRKDYENKIIKDPKECELYFYEFKKCYALRLNQK